MNPVKHSLILFSAFSLLATGCENSQPTASKSPAPTEATAPPETSASPENGHAAKPQAGGQVVESGPYYLELVTAPEANGTHIDFFLQTGNNHEAIADAEVTADVQLPDGSVQSLSLPYDAEGEHYAALLKSTAPGEYQVSIASNIKGETVKGRFSFTK
ncbi:MAG: hypothetical protein HC934_03985 [Acaryochloridaceae cyanobacterium SU_2_1]|nr:hypothetical protein [Acaryochloridaceae cyanobacterium SU_2_1]